MNRKSVLRVQHAELALQRSGSYCCKEQAFHQDLAAMTREYDFLVLPPVYELLARKR